VPRAFQEDVGAAPSHVRCNGVAPAATACSTIAASSVSRVALSHLGNRRPCIENQLPTRSARKHAHVPPGPAGLACDLDHAINSGREL